MVVVVLDADNLVDERDIGKNNKRMARGQQKRADTVILLVGQQDGFVEVEWYGLLYGLLIEIPALDSTPTITVEIYPQEVTTSSPEAELLMFTLAALAEDTTHWVDLQVERTPDGPLPVFGKLQLRMNRSAGNEAVTAKNIIVHPIIR